MLALNTDAFRLYLKRKRYSSGITNAFTKTLGHFRIRFNIVDDSGSMNEGDGHRLVKTHDGSFRRVECTRWTEVSESMIFQAELAQECLLPTEFHFLNKDEVIEVGCEGGAAGVDRIKDVFSSSPSGGTPICEKIRHIVQRIQSIAGILRELNQKACIVIATDGEATDGDIMTAMAPLKNLPCWVVIRLCTDEPNVVKYWNRIESKFESQMDVLDDFYSEAEEVRRHNDWLVYGEPMHRLREWGADFPQLDKLDEEPLSPEEMRFVASIILDVHVDEIPCPIADFTEFENRVSHLSDGPGEQVWSPVKNKMKPWLSLKRLRTRYQSRGQSALLSVFSSRRFRR